MNQNMEQPLESPVQPFVPLMSKERFAELSGVPFGVVDGWCNRGYIPTVVVGKHRMVNLVQLHQNCLEQLPR